jgi:hypothetical protein
MEEKQPHWALSILYWPAWLICGFLVIVDLMEIREASLAVVTAIQIEHIANAAGDEANSEQFDATLHTIDLFMFYLGAMLAVSMAVVIEYYFRFGLRQGKLLQRWLGSRRLSFCSVLSCGCWLTFLLPSRSNERPLA